MRSACFPIDPPPGFRPFDPSTEVSVYHRRLPHWRQKGATYFVTFRLADSLPSEALARLGSLKREWTDDLASREATEFRTEGDRKTAWEELSRHALATVEHWLDRGIGECLLRETRTREVLMDSLVHDDGEEAELCAAVIMPNHVHIIVRPCEDNTLETYLQRRKRHCAREVNRIAGRRGQIWQEESFDRIVRDTEHRWRCLQYIGRNARKAGLEDHEFTRWVRDDWVKIGWEFIEEEGA